MLAPLPAGPRSINSSAKPFPPGICSMLPPWGAAGIDPDGTDGPAGRAATGHDGRTQERVQRMTQRMEPHLERMQVSLAVDQVRARRIS